MNATQLATLAIIDHAHDFEWSVQGFGVLRLFIRKVGRLHIWTDSLRYPGVSLIHNHNWNLVSEVVFGRLVNRKYIKFEEQLTGAAPYRQRTLISGFNHSWVSSEKDVWLIEQGTRELLPGSVYHQMAHEIHASHPEDGTVTIMRRDKVKDGGGEADVFWPSGTEWGTAQPRPATVQDITLAVDAFRRLFERTQG